MSGELDGVAEKIEQHLPEVQRIDHHPCIDLRDTRHLQAELLAIGHASDQDSHILNQGPERHRFGTLVDQA